MTFINRKINVKFEYGTGPKGMDEPRVVELTGHRILCNAVTAGGAGMGQLNLRIYGLTPQLMAELSTVGRLPMAYARNVITVYAGDDKSGITMIYQGSITAAYADMIAAPEIAFTVTAMVGFFQAVLSIPDSCYPGEADAAVIMKNLADKMGMKFEDNGVSVILRDSVFSGSARQQAAMCAKNANIDWVIDKGVLSIWPKNAYRGKDTEIPVISPLTGLVGYPTYTATGIICTILYNPAITFGQLVEIQSDIIQANGKWRVILLTHDLAAELPNGPWFSQVQLAKPESLHVA